MVEKEAFNKICDMKMNRWKNGTCLCVLSLKTKSGKEKDACDILAWLVSERTHQRQFRYKVH